MPTFDVQPTYSARAIGAAVAITLCGGLLWSVFIAIFGAIPYLPGLAAVGLGYGAGELLSLSVNRKRSKGLAWIAGSSVGGAFLITWLIVGSFFGPFGLLLIIAGVFVAGDVSSYTGMALGLEISLASLATWFYSKLDPAVACVIATR